MYIFAGLASFIDFKKCIFQVDMSSKVGNIVKLPAHFSTERLHKHPDRHLDVTLTLQIYMLLVDGAEF